MLLLEEELRFSFSVANEVAMGQFSPNEKVASRRTPGAKDAGLWQVVMPLWTKYVAIQTTR